MRTQTSLGRGPRFDNVHAGGDHGFVPNAKLVFHCKKSTLDTHDETDGDCYWKYFKEQLISNLPPRSVIVPDNAAYHSRKKEPLPTTSWRKDQIKQWLEERNISVEEYMLKKDLLTIVAGVKPRYEKYKVDEMAREAGHDVLRLPPYHCEFNPIELVWSQVIIM